MDLVLVAGGMRIASVNKLEDPARDGSYRVGASLRLTRVALRQQQPNKSVLFEIEKSLYGIPKMKAAVDRHATLIEHKALWLEVWQRGSNFDRRPAVQVKRIRARFGCFGFERFRPSRKALDVHVRYFHHKVIPQKAQVRSSELGGSCKVAEVAEHDGSRSIIRRAS